MPNKKLIYLNYNVFAYYHDNKDPRIRLRIDKLRDAYRFCYSPAHLEDIGSSLMWNRGQNKAEAKKIAKHTINKAITISKITEDLEIFPGTGCEPAKFIREFPARCLDRVLKHADRNYSLDPKERSMLEGFKAQDPKGATSNVMANMPVDFLCKPEYENPLLEKLKSSLSLAEKCARAGVTNYTWESISKSQEVMEHIFEVVFNHLEEIRYKPDAVKKSRSRMHDVSHAIYAAHADYFVTNDGGFSSKARVVYSYLGVPTEVVDYLHFMEQPELFECCVES